jgi:hypothetical protein
MSLFWEGSLGLNSHQVSYLLLNVNVGGGAGLSTQQSVIASSLQQAPVSRLFVSGIFERNVQIVWRALSASINVWVGHGFRLASQTP